METFVNTSENINPVVKVEFTMNCKVIYGFDLSLSKIFYCILFLLSESTDKFERRLALVWSFSERGIGKDNLGMGAGLVVVFMVNKPVLLDNVIYCRRWIMKPISVCG